MSEKNNGFSYKDGVTLKEYFLSKLDSQAEALKLARESLIVRLESMNEFRNQLKEQASTFITRTEHELLIKKYDDEIKQLNKAKDILYGKASQQSVNLSYLLGLISLITALLAVIHSFIK